MKTLRALVSMVMVLSLILLNVRDAASQNRGVFPRLLANGQVIDLNGKHLGSITADGHVYEKSGKLIGLINEEGEISFANGKGLIGVIVNDTLRTKGGSVISISRDGVVMVSGQFAAFVDQGYTQRSFGCALHYFFNINNAESKEVDMILNQ